MLLTLTSLSGLYCLTNMMFVKRNRTLLKNNMFFSIRCKNFLEETTILNDSISYKINHIKSDKLSIDKYFAGSYRIQKFNTVEECKTFCTNNSNLKFDYSCYNNIVIDDENCKNIWVIYNYHQYAIIKPMPIDTFKSQIIKNNQLPFNKLNIVLFIALLVIYYESHFENSLSKSLKLKMI